MQKIPQGLYYQWLIKLGLGLLSVPWSGLWLAVREHEIALALNVSLSRHLQLIARGFLSPSYSS